jgi:GR25 family glycosyltransferase involved in LPS biosynthesis
MSNIIELWNILIDKTYIISLDNSFERRDKLDIELKRINLINYEYILVKKDNEDTKRGCFNSHKELCKLGINNNYDRILILEDDAIFVENLSKIKDLLLKTFNYISNNDFNIFFLGHLPVKKLNKISDNIVSTSDSRFMHSYILSRNGMKEIYDLKYKNEHIDFDIRNIDKKSALYPMIAYQDDVFTGNDYSMLYKIVSKLRNKISCRRICRFFEIFNYYRFF